MTREEDLLERVETAVRKVLDHVKMQSYETGIETVLTLLIDELQQQREELHRSLKI